MDGLKLKYSCQSNTQVFTSGKKQQSSNFQPIQNLVNKFLPDKKLDKTKLRFQSGITLIELITIIAIIAILATLAAPNFASLIKKRSADTAINNIFRNIELARTTAVSQGVTVTLCTSKDKQTCTASGGNFFLSFLDPDQDAAMDSSIPLNSQIIRITKAGKKTSNLIIKNFSGIKGTIQFQADGMTIGSVQTGSITYCPTDKVETYGRMIAIARTGRARIRAQEEFDGKTNSGNVTESEPNIIAICS